MMAVAEAMARLLAPILTFTAEEVWLSLPGYPGKAESVHLAQFPDANEAHVQPELAETWKTLIAVRGEVARALEAARQNKVLGHSLDAAVVIAAPEKLRALLSTHREDLQALLIVSDVRIADEQAIGAAYRSAEIAGLAVGGGRAKGEKCDRCWDHGETVGENAGHPPLGGRCLGNL